MTDQVDPNAPAPAGETMPNETLFEKAAELIHEAEAKVEALIHPSAAPADPQAAPAAETPTTPAADTPVSTEATPENILADMEADALFWGGEGMDKIRHHIGRLRQALNL